MAKRKLLFRIGNLSGGGAEKVLLTILKNLDRNRFEIDLFLHEKTGVYIPQIPNDVNVIFLGKGEEFQGNSWLPKFIERKVEKKKRKWFQANTHFVYNQKLSKKYDVEIVFLHDLIPFIKNSPVPKKIGWIHNDLANPNYLSPEIKKDIVDSSQSLDKVVCVSQQAMDSFITLGGDAAKTKVIYNPIDRNEILVKSQKGDADFEDNKINLIAIGRLHKQKRFDRLIEAIELLIKKGFDNIRLRILGKGELKDELQAMIDKKGLNEVISLDGFVANPYPYISASDVNVISSDFEGFSLVLAEAMILDLPTVSTKVVGPIELTKNGELGVLVDKTVEDLAVGLEKLIDNETLYNQFVERMKKTEFPFELQTTMAQIEDLLENI